MKTYIPFVIAFVVGFSLSGSFGIETSGTTVLFILTTLTALGALAWCYLEEQDDTNCTGQREAGSPGDSNPLWDVNASWKTQ